MSTPSDTEQLAGQLDRFPRTRKALAEFDAAAPVRELAWEAAKTTRQARLAQHADAQAQMRVQDAFFEDTKHYNTHEVCRATSVKLIRELLSTPGDTHR